VHNPDKEDVMFLSSENYLDQVKQLADSSCNLSLAVAFWGDGSEKLFESWQGESLRILCNLGSGGTNPYVIRRLLALANTRCGIEMRTLDDLHAKVMLGDSAALIGSANFSANGLGLEGDECSGWCEAGLFTNEPKQLDDARTWFEIIWSRAASISEEALRQAEENWKKRRDLRPSTGVSRRLVDQQASALRDRQVYLAIYWEPASEQAHQTFAEIQHELELSDRRMRQGFDFFEGWPDDKENALPEGADIIMIYYGPNGGIKVQSAWRRDPELDKEPIKVLRKILYVGGWSFSRQDQDLLAKRLKPWLQRLNEEGFFDDGARRVPLYTFLAWEAHNVESEN